MGIGMLEAVGSSIQFIAPKSNETRTGRDWLYPIAAQLSFWGLDKINQDRSHLKSVYSYLLELKKGKIDGDKE